MAIALTDLKALYDEHARLVRRVIIRLGAPAADVDDLLQEVFLVALRKRETFEGRSSHRIWLCGIAVRLTLAARRRARVRELFGLDEAPEPVETRTPVAILEQSALEKRVRCVLDKMTEKKRAVLVLFELEGLSGKEIAEAVGCPLKTVWTRLHHARQEFLQLLREPDRVRTHFVDDPWPTH